MPEISIPEPHAADPGGAAGTREPLVAAASRKDDISRALYDDVRGRLLAFARGSHHRGYWEALCRDADDGDAIPVDRFRRPRPLLQRTSVQNLLSRRALASLGGQADRNGAVPQTAAAELLGWAAGLSPDISAGLDVLLWRALNAFDALELVHPEDLLPADCLDGLAIERPTASLEPVAEPRAGKSMDYAGYACVILKATRRCNLRCVYCHDWQELDSPIMPISLQLTLFRRLLREARFSVVDIVWHGGEPTLLGRARLQKALFLQRSFCDERHIIRNSIQTNATLIDDGWVSFFRRYRFRVGVSIDGPAELHDRTRCGVNGRPTFGLVRRGLRLLKEAGLLSGVIMVATPALVEAGASSILDFLESEGIASASILPVRPGSEPGSNGATLPVKDYVGFLIRLEAERRRRAGRGPRIREIETVRRAVNGTSAYHCELLGNCIGAFFAVEPDGRVWHCDKFAGDPAYELGNIRTHGFRSLQLGPAATRLRTGLAETLQGFSGCRYRHMCQGWCPHEHYVAGHHDGPADCCGLAPLFACLQDDAGRQ